MFIMIMNFILQPDTTGKRNDSTKYMIVCVYVWIYIIMLIKMIEIFERIAYAFNILTNDVNPRTNW